MAASVDEDRSQHLPAVRTSGFGKVRKHLPQQFDGAGQRRCGTICPLPETFAGGVQLLDVVRMKQSIGTDQVCAFLRYMR